MDYKHQIEQWAKKINESEEEINEFHSQEAEHDTNNFWGDDNDIKSVAPWFGEWLETYEDGDSKFEGDHDFILRRLLTIKKYLYDNV